MLLPFATSLAEEVGEVVVVQNLDSYNKVGSGEFLHGSMVNVA
jgi:hypothetical protein